LIEDSGMREEQWWQLTDTKRPMHASAGRSFSVGELQPSDHLTGATGQVTTVKVVASAF
jgi:hypothetical protein